MKMIEDDDHLGQGKMQCTWMLRYHYYTTASKIFIEPVKASCFYKFVHNKYLF